MFQIRLKELREKKGLSQYQLAPMLGVAQSTVGSWEAGKREPNFETIQRIANFFNVSVDYLLGNTFIDYVDAVHTGDKATPEQQKLIEEQEAPKRREDIIARYDYMNPKGQKKAYEYVKDLSKLDEYTKKGESL